MRYDDPRKHLMPGTISDLRPEHDGVRIEVTYDDGKPRGAHPSFVVPASRGERTLAVGDAVQLAFGQRPSGYFSILLLVDGETWYQS